MNESTKQERLVSSKLLILHLKKKVFNRDAIIKQLNNQIRDLRSSHGKV